MYPSVGSNAYLMCCGLTPTSTFLASSVNVPYTSASAGSSYELPADADVYGTFTDEAKKVDVGVRPQHIKYAFEPTEGYIKCTVYSYESIGNKSVIVAEKDGMFLRMIAPNGLSIKIDQDVYVDMMIDQTMFFDAETKDYLTRYNEAAVKALVAELEG